MPCQTCLRDVPIENKDTGNCATCNKKARDVSSLYTIVRKMFMRRCVANGVLCPRCFKEIDMDDTVHHKKGRGDGYADRWAQELGITLDIDVRWFLAMCGPCHTFITEHSALALKRGWSVLRTAISISPLTAEEEEEIAVFYRQLLGSPKDPN